MLFKVKADLFNENFSSHFFEEFDNKTEMKEAGSLKELTEMLRKYNTHLDDSLFVYCQASPSQSQDEAYKAAIRLIKADSRNPLIVVRDPAAAEQLQMKAGTFYCYYKPSYINGFAQIVG